MHRTGDRARRARCRAARRRGRVGLHDRRFARRARTRAGRELNTLLRRAAAGAACASAISLAAYRGRALDASGAVAAFVVGTVTVTAGAPFALVLLAFFVPSTVLSAVGRERKHALRDIAKSGPRDGMQVAANGGIATVCAALALAAPSGSNLERRARAAFVGACGAATADTWATEIGTLATEAPRSILSGRPLPAGLSGGITTQGTLASVAGALWIAVAGRALLDSPAAASRIALAGTVGSFADSYLGALAQERRYCPVCDRECENDPHACGAPTTHRRGFRFVSNDTVNVAATAAGAAVAALIG